MKNSGRNSVRTLFFLSSVTLLKYVLNIFEFYTYSNGVLWSVLVNPFEILTGSICSREHPTVKPNVRRHWRVKQIINMKDRTRKERQKANS